jgi:hypothetical protein
MEALVYKFDNGIGYSKKPYSRKSRIILIPAIWRIPAAKAGRKHPTKTPENL